MPAFRPGKPKLILRRATSFPGTGSTEVTIPWEEAVEQDPVGQWTAGDPTVITIARHGLYLVTWNLVRGAVSSSSTMLSTLNVNGVNHLRTFAGASLNSLTATGVVTAEFTEGTILLLRATPVNGAATAWNLGAARPADCTIAVTRIGPVRWTG